MEVPISEEPESIDFLLPQIPDEGLTLTQHSVRDCPHYAVFFPSTATPPIFKLIWKVLLLRHIRHERYENGPHSQGHTFI